MKNRSILALILIMAVSRFYSQVDSLHVNYYENYPFAYKEGTTLKGIEIDIIEEYVAWLKQKKNIQVKISYTAFSEFGAFYTSIKEGGASFIGLGSVTDNAERQKEVLFSPPYLENIAVLITDGSIQTIKTTEGPEVVKVLKGMSAIVVSKSNHVAYINNIQKTYNKTPHEGADMTVAFTEKQSDVLNKIASDKKVFGYADIVAYWAYLKKNPTKFLKMQKVFTESKEFLGFIMPKKSVHSAYINEFFESGFGFTSTKMYHQILEKYLGYEIIEAVEIK